MVDSECSDLSDVSSVLDNKKTYQSSAAYHPDVMFNALIISFLCSFIAASFFKKKKIAGALSRYPKDSRLNTSSPPRCSCPYLWNLVMLPYMVKGIVGVIG